MACSVSFSHLDRVTPPLEEINHIWAYLRQVDRYYIRTSVGDIPMLAICLVDWNFLGATATTLLFPRSAGHIDATLASCAHPNFVSSGHACARLNATRLGSVHLPGDARRTQVRRSRHLPFYDPKVEGRQVTRV
ncbi:hypothetical protein CRG98_031050 [Punica granatum]|uniref:Uncharacterized protein n=1 Tax=Punica granatum TaxID=22663 RepID=A0A2I0IX47_PUNGR|nr:hypothetical protein CRG98_031050 [Punica granatum]